MYNNPIKITSYNLFYDHNSMTFSHQPVRSDHPRNPAKPCETKGQWLGEVHSFPRPR